MPRSLDAHGSWRVLISPDDQSVARLLATLDPEDRAAGLSVLEREASGTAPDMLDSGKKNIIPEEQLQKAARDMDEEVSTLSPAVQGVTVECLVSLIKRKEPTVSQNNAAPRGTNSRRGITTGVNDDDAKPT